MSGHEAGVSTGQAASQAQVGHQAALLTQVDAAAAVLRPLPGAQRWLNPLAEVRQQVVERRLQVAVFGAFSAGKSSLLNALFGQPLLAVSPNPTTAAVTHVHPADGGEQRAVVFAKTEAQLWEDVRLALAACGWEADSLSAAAALAAGIKLPSLPPGARKAGSFLKAFAAGYADLADRLGQRWSVPLSEVRPLIAEEKRACFIHRVDLWADANALLPGVTWVDTPGVDSVHRRHTDVAFSYMQSADAVLFVLYYTHAFTRADRDFLQQLAQVQDVLARDKLFVVLNAVDLAQSPEELAAVCERVTAELRRLGVRQPRVYPVSSQQALAAARLREQPQDAAFQAMLRQRLGLPGDAPLPPLARVWEDSGLPRLAADVQAFLQNQADQLAVDAVQRRLTAISREVTGAAAMRRAQWQQDSQARQAWQAAQQAAAAEMLRLAEAAEAGASEAERSLLGDWEELSFHMGERLRLRFSGLFREAFHPGRFRGRDDRLQLQEAAAELAESIARQVEAEARTFALRLRQHVEQAFAQEREALRQQLQSLQADPAAWPDDRWHTGLWPEPDGIPQLRARLDPGLLQPVFRYFSSSRQFFEGGGHAQMRAAAEPLLLDPARQTLAAQAQVLQETALTALRGALAELWRTTARQLQAAADAPVPAVDAAEQAAWLAAEQGLQAAAAAVARLAGAAGPAAHERRAR
ncbi:MAG: dynamin family protein [Alicyclobacillus sp.]|nr:dynamin family protein [Alicyclobacillus sp.]